MSKFVEWLKSIHFEKALIVLSITIILSVELMVNCVSMAILSPGDVEKFGFIAMALVIVFLGLPSYLIGKKGLWICFVILAVFLNTSFIVESLMVQSAKSNPELDYEVKRLDKLISDSATAEVDLQIQYNNATQAANMALLDGQIKAKQKERGNNDLLRIERIKEVSTNPVIKGSNVFVAIPRSSGLFSDESIDKMSGPIQLCFFLLLFVSSQIALVAFSKKGKEAKEKTSAPPETKPNAVPPKRLTAPDDISRFVSITWTYLRNNRGNAAVTRESFQKYTDKSPKKYSMETWDKLMAQAVLIGLISNGRIMEPNQSVAIKKLQEAMG